MDASKALPNELWLQALGYLSKRDLKAVRMTAEPHLNSLASSLLFTTAYVAARRGVLDTFTNLTTHPVFREYVTEVVFDCSWIDPATVTKHADSKCGSALASLFQEQEALQANELQTRMEDAFACLSNVRKVSYADLSRISFLPGDFNDAAWGCDYLDGPLIRRLESEAGLGPGYMSVCCLAANQTAGCPHHDDKFQYRRRFGGLTLLLQVLSNHASTTLLELSLGNRAHSCGTRAGGGIPDWLLWSGSNVTMLGSLTKIFGNLRILELNVAFVTPYGEHYDSANLAKLLCSARNLEELKVISDRINTLESWTNPLATYTWTRLRVFFLKWFAASSRDLEDFLTRHTRTLKNVTLENFLLTSGSWRDFATIVPAVAPNLEFILGYVYNREGRVQVDNILPLSYLDFAVSGPKRIRYAEAKTYENDQDDEGQEEIEEEDEDDESSSEELDYSSDDSSPETDEPRRVRGSDIALLDVLEPQFRSMVEKLRSELPGCPVQECVNALVGTRDIYSLPPLEDVKSHDAARRLLMRRFGYTELDTMDSETRTTVERLMEDMPFDCDVVECKDAVLWSGGNYDRARRELQCQFGHRQKIFMGAW